MRALILLLLLACSATSWGQGFNLRYDYQGWFNEDFIWDVELQDDGYACIKMSRDSADIDWGLSFMKLNFEGGILFEKFYWLDGSGLYAGWANSTGACEDGGYIMGGGYNAGYDQCFLAKFNSEGDTLWTRVFGDLEGSEFYTGRCAIATLDGGCLLVGEADDGSGLKGLLIKTDSEGNEEWRRLYGDGYSMVS